MEKKEEKIFRDIVKILEQDVPQEALAEGNPTPEQEAIALIKQELDKAREEVERKFVEKYHKRGEEMNVPYSEEDGKEFWQGYKEGYNQGLKDMIVDTYYLDKEFELKLKQ
jgi:flagellar biosynthesis/type III secretory pathway protein FliH